MRFGISDLPGELVFLATGGGVLRLAGTGDDLFRLSAVDLRAKDGDARSGVLLRVSLENWMFLTSGDLLLALMAPAVDSILELLAYDVVSVCAIQDDLDSNPAPVVSSFVEENNLLPVLGDAEASLKGDTEVRISDGLGSFVLIRNDSSLKPLFALL